MNLTEVPSGRKARIESILDPVTRDYLLRLGIVEGSTVECVQRMARGPVVVRKSSLELSLGRRVAERILVSSVGDDP
ncbi:MAG: ferrous iron transport protein A [Candidatus Thermoplasmatota archaeon]|nr:ferrous iron transport protein A [Candidatus Thermoplasmatota archaeon]